MKQQDLFGFDMPLEGHGNYSLVKVKYVNIFFYLKNI